MDFGVGFFVRKPEVPPTLAPPMMSRFARATRWILPAVAVCGAGIQAQTPLKPTQIPAGQGTRLGFPKPATDMIAGTAFNLTYATHAPGDTARLFVCQQRGVILVLDLGTNTFNGTPFLDIDSISIGSGERGLLGLAFHPDYSTNGLFYVHYTNNASDNVIAEYSVSGNPDIADAGSARILMTINQPQTNHNGGWIGFSPLDEYLYIATGDGGNFCDTGAGHTAGIGNSQDLTSNLLGKMLRIDPIGAPYTIPPTNPFVGISGDDEIWSYGLRNPWRCSFDRLTGDLYMGDVGQDIREEISYQPGTSLGGENYGWRCREGNTCSTFGASGCPGTTGCNCPGADPALVEPVHSYNHSPPPPPAGFVCTVIGGYVYRGSVFPQLNGHYFFSDHCATAIWSIKVEGGVQTAYRDWSSKLSPSIDGFTINSIRSFGEDANGELYICAGARLFKIVPK